ncbi:hypothetical protein APICC_07265 [Apis cerana cerana]|uniref:Uncharacterized protein n=1 Tax=Apis cerana cerana TaxID=94128 RepID=A0A2A3E1J5_APICC|nr:hypothetical protein APICC_07265 [Apis cerana cerana]
MWRLEVASENAQTSYYSSFKTNETSETDNNTELINNMEVDDLDTTIPITELYDLHKLEEKYIEESTSFEPIINGEARKKENSYKDTDIVMESFTQAKIF